MQQTNIKEGERPKAYKTKEQDLQLVTLLRNEFLHFKDFCQKIFPLRSTAK